jgi:hypothetical protein
VHDVACSVVEGSIGAKFAVVMVLENVGKINATGRSSVVARSVFEGSIGGKYAVVVIVDNVGKDVD